MPTPQMILKLSAERVRRSVMPGWAVARRLLVMAGGALLVAGCAGPAQQLDLTTAGIGAFDPDGTYQLSAAEQSLSCRRLTGRMQVRILQVRDRRDERSGTFGAMIANSSLVGSANPSGAAAPAATASARDVKILEAYNRALVAKNCPSFDLGAELKPRPVAHTPRPFVQRDR
ncbi:MAG: hypothetical protein AAFR55_06440 [Pseudomonadota bacterium]